MFKVKKKLFMLFSMSLYTVNKQFGLSPQGLHHRYHLSAHAYHS